MKLYNTLTRQIDDLSPLNAPKVTIYTCGPTVYDYAHIGHWFTYVRWDILVRAVRLAGFEPDWMMNITDVGHLVSDADDGEDKLEKGARREGKTAWEVAEFYTKDFLECMQLLNIQTPTHIVKATDHIAEQIALVQTLEAKGYTYVIDDGVYYDTSKFEGYADFAHLDLDDQQAGARVAFNAQKRNPSDFALWKFSPKDQKRDMEWWAPWRQADATASEQHPIGWRQGQSENGEHVGGGWGFPGWHIECSAMSMKYFGATLDIHAGGIDHVPVHHTNEIAQSEAATGKRFANVWLHSNHVMVNGEKVSKSLGNGIRLQEILARGIPAAAVRLHILESHYRSQSKFSWESLEAAHNRLKRWRTMADRRWQVAEVSDDENVTHEMARLHAETVRAITSDLNTSLALSKIDECMNLVEHSPMSKKIHQYFVILLHTIDDILGISVDSVDINDTQKRLLAEREIARKAKDWATSDKLRERLEADGIGLNDTPAGAVWYRL